jgi:hypothetical protein
MCVLLALSCGSCATFNRLREPKAPQASAQWYLATMYQQIALSRRQMPVLTLAGQAAARRAVNGGYIWVGGSQGDFQSEAVGRAGGLMGVKPLDVSQVFRKDVVLYGARGALSAADLASIARCKAAGAYVIAFAEAEGSLRTPQGPDLLIDSGSLAGLPTGYGICPLDTVGNIINLWVFTGEFTAACTRLGKMPVHYKSYHLTGGRERAAKYQGQTFHDDMTIAPVAAGVLGNQYLDRITQILLKVEHDDLDVILQTGRWIRGSDPRDCGLQFVGHIFPDHIRDPRAAQPIHTSAGEKDAAPTTAVLVHISYQRPPQELIDKARREHTRLFYCSVLRGEGGIAENSLYANPHWPLDDGCVQVPGYDIPILPASGVIQASIYWSIVAEVYRGY